MSASPRLDPAPPPIPSPHSAPPPTPGPTTAPPTTVSPPALPPAPSPPSGDARLLAFLSDTIHERDDLLRDVSALRKRLERAEHLLRSLSQSSPSSSSGSSSQAYNAFHEYEARLEVAETARDEAETRRRVITDNWFVLVRHLEFLESQALEARASFSRFLREGGPPFLDPLIQAQPGQSLSTTHAIYAMPPPMHPARHHHVSSSRPGSSRSILPTPQSTIPFSNVALPPPPTTKHHPPSRVRPRASSVDGSMEISGQPPSKKSRASRHESERRGRGDRVVFTESPVDSPHIHNPPSQSYKQSPPYSNPSPSLAHQPAHPIHVPHRSMDKREHEEYLQRASSHEQFSRDHPRIHPSEADQPDDPMHFAHSPENELRHRGRRPRNSRRTHRSNHQGSSRSSSRSSASSVDALILEATGTDDPERKTPGPNGIPFNIPGAPHNALRQQAAQYRSRVLTGSPSDMVTYPQASSRMRADSPSSDYRSHSTTRHHDHPAIQTSVPMTGPGMSAEAIPGPLPQPGQLQTYQTHVFAPVVTGAPVKKTKYREEYPPAPSDVVLRPAPPAAPETVPPPPSFPATNAQGQRICRQCGMPGRYKDGKCVEKWGPGPHGSGTVCDRCRKKMKRVERRGTMEVQNASMHSLSTGSVRSPPVRQTHSRGSQQVPVVPPERAMHRTDTLPVSQPYKQQQLGPGGTHIITPDPSSASISYAQRPQAPLQQQQQQPQVPMTGVKTSGSSAHGGRPPPPSPPAIATLDDGGSADNLGAQLRPPAPSSRSHSRSSSRNGRRVGAGDGNNKPSPSAPPVPVKRSSNGSRHSKSSESSPKGRAGSGEGDNDGDGDVDAEAEPDIDADAELDIDAALDAAAATGGEGGMDVDADADAELLEAVDAAEANTAGSHGPAAAATSWLNNQD